MNNTQTRVALVTGAAGGIGRGIALQLASQGFCVAVAYRENQTGAGSTVEQIREMGGRAEAMPLDVTSLTSISAGFDATERAFGRIDLLVNNAGVNLRHDPLHANEELYEATFRVNVKGLYFNSIEAARRMLAQAAPSDQEEGGATIRGRIINISAVTGRTIPPPGMILYGASKAAVDALTRGLAAEWGPQGILVNAVAPGITETELIRDDDPQTIERLRKSTSLGRLGKPRDVARLVGFLARDRWIVGQSINASGGRLI